MRAPTFRTVVRQQLREHALWIGLIAAMLALLVVMTIIAIFVLPQGGSETPKARSPTLGNHET
jgi:hypothetical protein